MKAFFWCIYLFLCLSTALLALTCLYSLIRFYDGFHYQWLLPAVATALCALTIMRDGKGWLKPPK